MDFAPNQIMHAIALSEAIQESFTVLVNALDQVGCDSYVQRPIAAAREKIYAWMFVQAESYHVPVSWVPAIPAGTTGDERCVFLYESMGRPEGSAYCGPGRPFYRASAHVASAPRVFPPFELMVS